MKLENVLVQKLELETIHTSPFPMVQGAGQVGYRCVEMGSLLMCVTTLNMHSTLLNGPVEVIIVSSAVYL